MTCASTWSGPWACCVHPAPNRPSVLSLTLAHSRLETEGPVATPNYGYEKRQKELAKKKKKEEKLKAKADRKTGAPGEGEAGSDEPRDGEPTPGTPQP
jgi:hypothetical protein